MDDFLTFIRKQGVVGLAIGFILGGSISKVVSSLVEDIINPLLSLLLGKIGNLNNATFMIGSATIKWGHFASVLIDFAVIALVIYIATKRLRLDRLDKKD